MANLNSVQLKKQKKADEYRYVEMKGKDRQRFYKRLHEQRNVTEMS